MGLAIRWTKKLFWSMLRRSISYSNLIFDKENLSTLSFVLTKGMLSYKHLSIELEVGYKRIKDFFFFNEGFESLGIKSLVVFAVVLNLLD